MADSDKEWRKKEREYEQKKARTKLALNVCTICGKKGGRPCKGCGTVAYCSTECQRIDWRARGHRKACKKIQDARAAEAARAEARAEAPTPPPSPPPEVFYGPAPRSHADEVRARIAAEHVAARARREAEPEPKSVHGERYGSRCPICLDEWDVDRGPSLKVCCCRLICKSCALETEGSPCALCRAPPPKDDAELLARLRRHVENDVPDAINELGGVYEDGGFGIVKNTRKAAKLYKRAMELGSATAALNLGFLYHRGKGVKMDPRKAMQLYRIAADQGNARAASNLGVMLKEDHQNFEEAFQYHKKAADLGLADSQYNVGVALWNGEGATPDLEEAIRWFKRAAAKGEELSIAALTRVEPELSRLRSIRHPSIIPQSRAPQT